MRLLRPCFIAGRVYREAIFRIRTGEKLLFLTFDDGPNPDSTPALLRTLGIYKVKALFFCDGRAAEKYPELIELIISQGHVIGNHGYGHLNGWKTPENIYLEDVSKAATFINSGLFRPPYGRIRLSQYNKLREKYRIVFWDLMPYDFDKGFGTERYPSCSKEKNATRINYCSS